MIPTYQGNIWNILTSIRSKDTNTILITYLKLLLVQNKLVAVIITSLTITMPFIEVLILTLIYLLLDIPTAERYLDLLYIYMPYVTLPSSLIAPLLAMCSTTLILLWALLRLYRTRVYATTRYNIYLNQVNKITDLYFALPGDSQLKEHNEDISNLMIHLSGSAAAFVMGWVTLASSIMSVAIFTVVVIYGSPLVTLIALTLGLLSMIINARNFSDMQTIGTTKITTHEEVLFNVTQNIRSFELIKYDGLATVIQAQLAKIITKDRDWRIDKRKTAEKITVFTDSFGLLSLLIVITVSVLFLQINIELLLILLLLLNRVRSHISEAQTSWTNIKEVKPAVTELLSTQTRLEGSQKQNLIQPSTITQVTMESVSFKYNDHVVVDDVSLDINLGDIVLFTGPSGEGKSTVLKLLSGYYRPTLGKVAYNKNNIDTAFLDFTNMHQHLFFAANDIYIPNVTIRSFIDPKNILTDNQIHKIMRQACLSDLFDNDWTLQSLIGDNGTNLSLGQRQRLLMSRIFKFNPSIILLDESTSNLDDETETMLFNNIISHLNEKYIIIIASHHAPSTLKFTQAYQVEKGQLINAETPQR